MLCLLAKVAFGYAQFNANLWKEVSESVTLKNTSSILNFLASDKLRGRALEDPEAIQKTIVYIEKALKSTKAKPIFNNSFRFKTFVNHQIHAENIVGIKDPLELDEYILVYANYDYLGVHPDYLFGSDDSIYNGANDNATGVALVLQLANFFNKRPTKKGVIFAFTSAKHHANMGVGNLASILKKENYSITLALHVEMLGRQNKQHMLLVNNAEKSTFLPYSNALFDKPVFTNYTDDNDLQVYSLRGDEVFESVYYTPSHTISSSDLSDSLFMTTLDDIDHIDLKLTHENFLKIIYVIAHLVNDKASIHNIKQED
jgi:hypothetical protein